MKKKIVLLMFMVSVNLFSQVGIGTLTPSESSQLEITSNNKGVLIPRVNINDLNTIAPITSQVVEESLLVYNTNTVSGKGFYYWAENKWNRLVDIDKVLNLIATHSDNQTITSFFLNNSNILTIEIENGGTATVDLSSLLNRNEVLTGAGSPITNAINPLSGNLYIDVDNGNLYSSNGSIWMSVTEKGVDGADGKTVLNGIGNPGRGVGGDNDFYINTTTNEIFGPKRAGQWGLGTSLVGPTGKKGKTVLNGIGNPGRGIGGDNDFYINTTTNEIFGPKRAGQWGLGTSLVGPVGKKGKTVLNGIGNPGRGVGEDNDFYINTTTNEIFGPKRAGQWGVGVSLVGAVGASGKTILNGNVIPTTEGVDGDFYVNTSTNMFYGPKVSGSWGVGVSLVGAVGASGKTILNGNVIPTTEGVDGDFYVNTSTNMFYGPKVSGLWGVGVSLVGAVGASGKTILNGNVIPTTEGVDGDFYVNTSTNMFYGPKVSGSWGVGVSLVGAVGASGKTILNGNVIPTTEGVDGDFYVNTSTNMFYGPKASGSWGVGISLIGAVGAPGKTILNGNVIPTTEGVDGDFYVNTSTNMFYGPKVSGSWGVGVSLVGAVGASGKTILNGNVIPTTEGVDGDFYVNTSTNMFYGPKVSGLWGVGVSLVGAVGASGKTILNGNVIPTTEGVDGDFYVNTSTNMFYGPKVSGSWGVGVSLVGAVGASGKTILNGNVIPTTEGVDGDFYVNTSTNMFYGPKVSGLWGVGVSLVGAVGASGKTILNGNVIPTTEGVDGDFYVNTSTNMFYGPKVSGSWGVGVSLVGAVGASGKTILNGNVIPTTEGVDGDFYVNTSTNMFYGPKVSGSWGVGVSLVGAVGASGKTILNGNVIPTTEGVDGDFYVNTSTNMFYGPKVSGSWGVGVSLVGASGVDGTLTGIVNPNGVLTGIAGQLYTNTVTGELYKTKDGITWELVDNDEQDMSLTGNIISLTKSLSTVDLSNSTLATSVTNNTTKIENLNRLNSIRVLTDPSSSTTILDSDGTVIIQNTALISLSLSPVLLPDPVTSNVGRKITIVYRTSGLVSLGINVTTLSGGNRIKGSVLNALNVSVVGTNTSVTYQCGLDPDGTNYWYVVNKSLL